VIFDKEDVHPRITTATATPDSRAWARLPPTEPAVRLPGEPLKRLVAQ
jgi:hypothetical protein